MPDQTPTPPTNPTPPTTTPPPTPEPAPDTGAAARIQALVAERDSFRAAAEAAAAKAQALEQQVSQHTGALDALRADLALAERGLTDPQARVVARALHGTVEGAPPLSEWAKALTPDTAPLALRPYLSPAAPVSSGSATSPDSAGAAGLPRAAASAPTQAPPPSPSAALKAATARMEAAMRGGDANDLAQARAEVHRLMAQMR